jgi:hypothetical protein
MNHPRKIEATKPSSMKCNPEIAKTIPKIADSEKTNIKICISDRL